MRHSGSMFYSASPGSGCCSLQSMPLSVLQRNCCLQTALEPAGLDLTPPHSGDSFDRANLGAELSSGMRLALQSVAAALSCSMFYIICLTVLLLLRILISAVFSCQLAGVCLRLQCCGKFRTEHAMDVTCVEFGCD